jgi:hypothetical protein
MRIGDFNLFTRIFLLQKIYNPFLFVIIINKEKMEIKKFYILILILVLAVVIFFVAKNNEGLSFFDKEANKNPNQTSQVQTEPPTCTDKIQNQGERLPDCGGPCDACPPDCSDGIQNQDETKVDCGGTICPACPTCTDGIQNQGEVGIDCWGPCPTACPIITALTADEVAKVRNAILSSEFVSALPNDGIISLHFFNYQYGQRVELDTFLIGKDQILTTGTPDISVIINSKYIAELTPTNLCEIIPKAKTNGDLAFGSELSDTKLLLKYSGMVKYRDCFGF